MSLDIGDILNDWPYDHGQVSARKIRGADSRDKIQLRLDIGLLQMETDGRPDGKRPHDLETLLDYYEQELHRQPAGPDSEPFSIDSDACEMLRNEAVMYYHRYLAEFVLEDYAEVIRDASRNLRAMDFCAEYAQDETDRLAMERYRPYVVMMCTRARGLLALRDNRPKAAMAAVRNGMEEIEEFYERAGLGPVPNRTGELSVLRGLVEQIESQIPQDPSTRIRKELDLAVIEERYEDAASLRDQLRSLNQAELASEES